MALNWAAVAAHQRVATYWHMLPEASQARKAIWDAIDPHTGVRRIDQAFPKSVRETTREQEMMIRFRNGSTWQVVGSDNYDSLVGSPPAGVVFSEWALAKPEAWAYIRPILMENGGWALFIYTSRGPNHGKTTYELFRDDHNAYAEILKADQTGVFTAEQLKTELAAYQAEYGIEQGASLFDQEYMCSFAGSMLGAFYAGELRRARETERVTKVPHDSYAEVWTAWDLGYTDSTAIWFGQVCGREIHLIDYFEGNSQPLSAYVEVLKDRANRLGYRYSKHYFPHDVQANELTIGKSRVAVLRELGVTPTVVPQHAVLDGINAVRRLFDRLWIDERNCERGLNAITSYRREWDDKRKIFQDRPYHDWSSHGSDALRCFAAGFADPSGKIRLDDPYRRGSEPERNLSWMAA